MKGKVLALISICFILMSAYSVYFYFVEVTKQKQGSFIRHFTHKYPTVSKRISLPPGYYYFAGKDRSRIWLGNEKAPNHLFSVSRDGEIHTNSLNSVQKDNAKIERGQLAYIGYPYYIMVNGAKKQIRFGHVAYSSEMGVATTPFSFDIASPAGDSTFLLRINTADGFQLAYYTPGQSLVKTSHLTTQGLSQLSRDGMILFDEREKLSAYVYYYRNLFIVFDRYRTASINTIDTVSFSLANVGEADVGGKRMKNTSTIAFNYRADISNRNMYIISKARSSLQSPVDRDSVVIDMYSVTDSKYVSSFTIPKHFKGKPIQDFRVLYPYMFILTENELILMRI